MNRLIAKPRRFAPQKLPTLLPREKISAEAISRRCDAGLSHPDFPGRTAPIPRRRQATAPKGRAAGSMESRQAARAIRGFRRPEWRLLLRDVTRRFQRAFHDWRDLGVGGAPTALPTKASPVGRRRICASVAPIRPFPAPRISQRWRGPFCRTPHRRHRSSHWLCCAGAALTRPRQSRRCRKLRNHRSGEARRQSPRRASGDQNRR